MNRHRLPAILLLITYLSACHTWRAETVTPQALIETSHPDQIRVVRLDGTKEVLSHVVVRADTLWGVSQEPAIPLSDVQTIETQHGDVGEIVPAGGCLNRRAPLVGGCGVREQLWRLSELTVSHVPDGSGIAFQSVI